jgi:hypothetical protein
LRDEAVRRLGAGEESGAQEVALLARGEVRAGERPELEATTKGRAVVWRIGGLGTGDLGVGDRRDADVAHGREPQSETGDHAEARVARTPGRTLWTVRHAATPP